MVCVVFEAVANCDGKGWHFQDGKKDELEFCEYCERSLLAVSSVLLLWWMMRRTMMNI